MFPPQGQGPGSTTAAPPLPPEIMAQIMAQQGQGQGQPQPAGPAGPMFAQMGPATPNIPDPVTVLQAQIAKLEQWAAETAPLTTQINPALTTLLVPIAQAGKALQAEIQNIQQRNAGPSQPVTGSNPPTVPGNIPGGRPVQ